MCILKKKKVLKAYFYNSRGKTEINGYIPWRRLQITAQRFGKSFSNKTQKKQESRLNPIEMCVSESIHSFYIFLSYFWMDSIMSDISFIGVSPEHGEIKLIDRKLKQGQLIS